MVQTSLRLAERNYGRLSRVKAGYSGKVAARKNVCLLAQVCLMFAVLAQGTLTHLSASKKRWTADTTYQSTGKYAYETEETYSFVDGTSESFRMQWEMYEGSIALTQMAVVWKEISTDSKCQIERAASGTKFTSEVVRIRRVWQLASKGASLGVYDDEAGQVVNQFANNEITLSKTTNKGTCVSDQWFAGDIIPFENCAYIV